MAVFLTLQSGVFRDLSIHIWRSLGKGLQAAEIYDDGVIFRKAAKVCLRDVSIRIGMGSNENNKRIPINCVLSRQKGHLCREVSILDITGRVLCVDKNEEIGVLWSKEINTTEAIFVLDGGNIVLIAVDENV